MALLRTSDRVAAELVYPKDAAVDKEASDHVGYLEHLDQPDTYLVYLDGKVPTRMHVVAVNNDDMADAKARARQGRIDDQHAADRLNAELVKLGLVKVVNPYGQGETLEGDEAQGVLPPDVIEWLGDTIWMLSHARPKVDHMRDLLKKGVEAEMCLQGIIAYLDTDEPNKAQNEAYALLIKRARELLKLGPKETDTQTLDDPKKSLSP